MSKDLHGSLNLLMQLLKILVSLVNFLVISLVFNLQLLEVDEIQTLYHLFLFFEQELALLELCLALNVFQAGLFEFFVFFALLLFEIINV